VTPVAFDDRDGALELHRRGVELGEQRRPPAQHDRHQLDADLVEQPARALSVNTRCTAMPWTAITAGGAAPARAARPAWSTGQAAPTATPRRTPAAVLELRQSRKLGPTR
jgi:hypothetical protein